MNKCECGKTPEVITCRVFEVSYFVRCECHARTCNFPTPEKAIENWNAEGNYFAPHKFDRNAVPECRPVRNVCVYSAPGERDVYEEMEF